MCSTFNTTYTIHAIIDVFRAFSTAAVILKAQPRKYVLANKCATIRELVSSSSSSSILVGKPEENSTLQYTIPNSPTLAAELALTNHGVYHRTAAGATGVLASKKADVVLCVGFNNLQATANYIKRLGDYSLVIKPMGHEANTATLEDDLCAEYLDELLKHSCVDFHLPIQELKSDSGKYFFQNNPEYPEEDFARCLRVNSHNFAIRADVREAYAHLYSVLI